MSGERSAEWLRGAVTEVRHLEGECDVVFRGDQPHVTRMALCERADDLKALLAAAEAREAAQPSAAEVQKQNNLRLLDEWKQSEEQLATAAEVIEATEVALGTIKHLSDWVSFESTGDLTINGVARNALALIARWKEANGGK